MKKHKLTLLLFLNLILFSCHSKLEPKIEPVENNYSVKIYKLDDEPAKRKILDSIDSKNNNITTKK